MWTRIRTLAAHGRLARLTVPLALAALVGAALLGLAGCRAPQASLNGTAWTLTGWPLSSKRPDDFAITALFEDGRIGGHSGVNSYGAAYTLGPGDAFALGEIESTLMAGSAEDMQAEASYLELLRSAIRYSLSSDALILYDGDGNELLIYGVAP